MRFERGPEFRWRPASRSGAVARQETVGEHVPVLAGLRSRQRDLPAHRAGSLRQAPRGQVARTPGRCGLRLGSNLPGQTVAERWPEPSMGLGRALKLKVQEKVGKRHDLQGPSGRNGERVQGARWAQSILILLLVLLVRWLRLSGEGLWVGEGE